MRVKLCGFTELESLQAAIAQNINFIGFVFYQDSVRNISLEQAKILSRKVPSNISKVAVTVNPTNCDIEDIIAAINPDFLQIHGHDDIEKIKQIKSNFPSLKIIKAISVNNSFDKRQAIDFEKIVDHILLDNKQPGSGQTFDWQLINDINFHKDWFLSGGLNCDNIKNAAIETSAPMIDISSGIEEIRGKKSTSLINKITTIIKTI